MNEPNSNDSISAHHFLVAVFISNKTWAKPYLLFSSLV
uniref:Uncharacterized protein n=1 Tax=Nelumbo nucifera TaxID=4432 RepID=A0A822ZRZ2_NELNU|nr:TPA_asm: hypothetical protein HUJ06_004349 [Nelumbo nucifera]